MNQLRTADLINKHAPHLVRKDMSKPGNEEVLDGSGAYLVSLRALMQGCNRI